MWNETNPQYRDKRDGVDRALGKGTVPVRSLYDVTGPGGGRGRRTGGREICMYGLTLSNRPHWEMEEGLVDVQS